MLLSFIRHFKNIYLSLIIKKKKKKINFDKLI
jgi:hypothetical protein